MKEHSYLNFDLSIDQIGPLYRARVLQSAAGEGSVEFALPFSNLELENFILKLGHNRRRTQRKIRGSDSVEMAAAKEIGGRLFNAVFQGEVYACLHATISAAQSSGQGVRILLRLNPGLGDLPWEYLYNAAWNQFFSLSADTPIVRYLELNPPIRPLPVSPPLRMLVMISSPSDFAALDTQDEWQRLNTALQPLIEGGLLDLDLLDHADLLTLQRKLRQETYHIFHFIGHGAFDEINQDGMLMFCDEKGRGMPLSGQNLGAILHDHRSLRLAVLNACEGARTSREDPFAGAAHSLVQMGLPAVIAMQFEISDTAAVLFAQEFYTALVDGYPLDAALADARKALFASGGETEWGTPVLFSRTLDGRIFDLAAAPAQPPNPITSPEPTSPQLPEHDSTPAASEPVKIEPAASAAPNPEILEAAARQAQGEAKRQKPDRQIQWDHAAFPASGDVTAERAVPFWKRLWVQAAGVFLLLVLSCNIYLASLPSGKTPAATSPGQSASKSATPTFTPTPTLTPTPTVPAELRRIAPGTIRDLTQVRQFGDGVFTDAALARDGSLLAVASTLGIYLISPATFDTARFISTAVWVTCVIFSPDGKTIAAGLNNGEIRLYSAEDGSLLQTRSAHTQGVSGLAFSPDGSLLVSSAYDKQTLIWRLADSTQLYPSLAGFDEWINSVDVSPDSRLVATGGEDKTVRIWDIAGGRLLQTFSGHTMGVTSVQFSADGSELVSGSYDRTVRVWRLADGKQTHVFETAAPVYDAAFSPDGKTVAAGDYANSINVWQLPGGKILAGFSTTLESYTLKSVVFTPDGSALITLDFYGWLRRWSLSTQEMALQRSIGHKIYALALSPDGQTLAEGGESGSIRLLNAANGQVEKSLTGQSGWAAGVAYSPDGLYVAAACQDGRVLVWRTSDGSLLHQLPAGDFPISVAFSPDGRYVAANAAQNVLIWNVSDGETAATLDGQSDNVKLILYSPDGKTLASAGFGKEVILWQAPGGTLQKRLVDHDVYAMAFSPDGDTLVTGDYGNVYFWNTASGDMEQSIFMPDAGLASESISQLVYTPDGSVLAAGASSGKIYFWEVETRRFLGAVSGHFSGVTGLVFSPDGRMLYSASGDGTLRVWGFAK